MTPPSLNIVHDDANSSVGGARPLPDGRFIVKKMKTAEEVDIVNSLDERILAISAYYKANPPQWELEPQNVTSGTPISRHMVPAT